MQACAIIGLLGLAGSVAAASPDTRLDLDSVNAANFPAKEKSGIDPVLVKAQVLLDRARFSPGVIDGHDGDDLHIALRAFETSQNLPVDGNLDEEVWRRLTETSPDPALIEYEIRSEDVKGPFVRIPEKMEERAHLDRLSYSSPRELLAEKFHMDQDLLEALNPGKAFHKAGTSIVVANVGARAADQGRTGKAARIEIVKSEHVLRVFAEDSGTLAVYPASIGSEEKPAPNGSFTVRAIARNPTYTYNPDYAFKGVKAKEAFEIKPGPNNPVGTVWIDLSIESYGIHGTPEPEKVGKSYSHGCIRLTNWDVEELAGMVRKDVPVEIRE